MILSEVVVSDEDVGSEEIISRLIIHSLLKTRSYLNDIILITDKLIHRDVYEGIRATDISNEKTDSFIKRDVRESYLSLLRHSVQETFRRGWFTGGLIEKDGNSFSLVVQNLTPVNVFDAYSCGCHIDSVSIILHNLAVIDNYISSWWRRDMQSCNIRMMSHESMIQDNSASLILDPNSSPIVSLDVWPSDVDVIGSSCVCNNNNCEENFL